MSPDNVTYSIIIFFTNKGVLGVNFFFVLSGFLITFLILFEIKHHKKFNLKKFLIRRTLRIWPLYFIIVLIGFVLFPFIFTDYNTDHNPLNYIIFFANLDEIWNGANDSNNFLTAPWSVAVEEQFYFVWGVLLFSLSRLKILQLPTLIIILLLGSIIFRSLNFEDYRVIYYHTFSVMPDILTGSLLAYFYFKKTFWIKKMKFLKKWKIILIYIIGFLVIIFKTKIFNGPLIIAERYVIGLFFAFILLDQIHLKYSFIKIGKIKLFNHLGGISYGLYMYHLVVLFLLHKLLIILIYKMGGGYYFAACLYFILSILISYFLSLMSYKFIEKPFLDLKRKFI